MPASLRRGAALLLVLSAACGVDVMETPAPLDRFYFPTALALHDGRLLVVSSNFDLRYSTDEGGTVLAVDPAAEPAVILGGVRMPSFGGEIAVAGKDACGLSEDTAFVASRSARALYRLGLGGGVPACGADCVVPLGDGPLDPYGVAVTCPAGGTPRAWVGYFRAPDGRGHVSALDLSPPVPPATTNSPVTLDVGLASPRSFAYDAEHDRLFFTSSYGAVTGLSWIELAGGCPLGDHEEDGDCPVRFLALSDIERGVDVRGLALSNVDPSDPTRPRRIYIAARVFDVAVAAAIGGRPGYDVGGLLLVLEISSQPTGAPALKLIRSVQVGLGASEVAVLPARPGQRDLVALTATTDGLLWIYDDEAGAMVKVFTRDPVTGAPLAGSLPFAMTVERLGDTARLYVASFERSFVTPVDVPLAAPGDADFVRVAGPGSPIRRIGQETP